MSEISELIYGLEQTIRVLKYDKELTKYRWMIDELEGLVHEAKEQQKDELDDRDFLGY